MQVNRKRRGGTFRKDRLGHLLRAGFHHGPVQPEILRRKMSAAKNRALPVGVCALLLGMLLIAGGCGGSSNSDGSISGQLTVVTSGSYSSGKPLSLQNLPLDIPLKVKGAPVIAETNRLSAEPDFVADEILVKYRPGTGRALAANYAAGSGYRVTGYSGGFENGVMVKMRLDQNERAGLSIQAQKKRTLLEIERLGSLPSVEYAQPNYIYKPLFTPNDTLYTQGLMWNYLLILVDHVWNDIRDVDDLSSVVVAVIDTGIVRSNGTKSGNLHPDLSGIFVDEYDFITDPSISLDGDGRDADATDVGDNGAYSSFHGTHVAGTIGALTNNNQGIAGVAGGSGTGKGVKIMPLRVLGAGGGTTEDIAAAVRYAAGDTVGGVTPSKRADVINMSLGSTADDPTLASAISYAASQGVVMAAAAGNDGTNPKYYPAAYPEVISVSAATIGAERASYSNYGDTIEIAAPGGSFTYDLNFDTYPDGVWSTLAEYLGPGSYNVNVYALSQGTSMATPHVAAAAALVKAANPDLNANAVRQALTNSAIDLGTAGKDDYYGYGLLNTYAAVMNALVSPPPPKPVLFPFPKTLKFQGPSPAAQKITLKNIVDATAISVTSITKKGGASWLSFSPSSGSADNTGMVVTVSVNTAGVADGRTHTERLDISWNDGANPYTEYAYVLYNSSGFTGPTADVGNVYVVAIDYYDTSDEVKYYVVTNIDQSFAYSLAGFPTGTYVIGASTDRDNDGYIFEIDDAYGFYPEILNVKPISYHEGDKITGIDFELIY